MSKTTTNYKKIEEEENEGDTIYSVGHYTWNR